MTPEQIVHHPLFAKLNERQQIFVEALLANGNDRVAAAHKAWTCNGDESAKTLANRAMRNESVSYLVDSYFGADPTRVQFSREQALDFLAKRARAATDDKIALDFMKVIVAMEGWAVKAQDKAPETKHDDSQDTFSLDD